MSRARPAPVLAGLALATLAGVEAILRGASTAETVEAGLAFTLLALATTLPLVFLKTDAAAVAATAGLAISLSAFHTATVAGAMALLICLYGAGRYSGQPWPTVLGLPFVVLALMASGRSEASLLAVALGCLAPAATLAGIAVGARTAHNEDVAVRQAMAGTLLEHSARGERARIARELHDVVAHHISMISVLAETARLTTPGLPVADAQRLMAIGDTARAALTEMRRLLGVLREDADADPSELRPQPGLRELNELIDGARDASGAGARLILRGSPISLDPGVELAAYRIVQEALTNTRRHAPGAAVDVELAYTDDALLVRIRDDGPGPPAAEPLGGHGLLGMRERALAVGGELATCAAAGGGFMVTASLPGKDEIAS